MTARQLHSISGCYCPTLVYDVQDACFQFDICLPSLRQSPNIIRSQNLTPQRKESLPMLSLTTFYSISLTLFFSFAFEVSFSLFSSFLICSQFYNLKSENAFFGSLTNDVNWKYCNLKQLKLDDEITGTNFVSLFSIDSMTDSMSGNCLIMQMCVFS